MTKQEQLAALQCASEELDGYVSNLAYAGVLTEDEAKDFDGIIEKIDKVAEAIRHETTSPTYVYVIHENCRGTVGCHKTFEGAKKQMMEYGIYQEFADNFPLDYDKETRWGWDIFHIKRIEVEE